MGVSDKWYSRKPVFPAKPEKTSPPYAYKAARKVLTNYYRACNLACPVGVRELRWFDEHAFLDEPVEFIEEGEVREHGQVPGGEVFV